MRVVILGSGTSAGVPTLGCRCAVCRSDDPRNKRMRASAYIEAGGLRLLIDCGPDFRTQALANGVEDVDFVLLTHAHADHVAGLDDLRSFNLVHKHPITLYGGDDTLADIRERFGYCFRPPTQAGGGLPDLRLETVPPDRGQAWADGDSGDTILRALPIPVFHGKLPIFGWRLGNFAYLTDVSEVPDDSLARLKGVDTLVTSTLRHRPHPTHMSLDESVALARRVGARRTWFVHMCHDLDHAETNAALPPDIQLAHDGLTFTVDDDEK